MHKSGVRHQQTGAVCLQVAEEMRALTDAQARSEALAEQLDDQLEEAQVNTSTTSS